MILVTGGAGYIGSHTAKALNNAGYEVVVVDNLCKGYETFVKWGNFENYDFGSKDLREVFEKYDIDGVLHFAAFSSVAESVEFPQKYFKNNYKNTLNLLQIMREFGVDKFILSSTAAVYGNPEKVPITEDQELKPINPYGHSKWITEKALQREAEKGDFNYVSLRYFNAAGCDFDCEIGELHDPETHLIPLVLDAAIGKRDSISIFGTDYDTPDGTGVRDYIHVVDLYIMPTLDCQYHLINRRFRALNLHADTSVPLIPYPAGASDHICRLSGAVAETNTLHGSIKNNMFTTVIFHINPLYYLFLVPPRFKK